MITKKIAALSLAKVKDKPSSLAASVVSGQVLQRGIKYLEPPVSPGRDLKQLQKDFEHAEAALSKSAPTSRPGTSVSGAHPHYCSCRTCQIGQMGHATFIAMRESRSRSGARASNGQLVGEEIESVRHSLSRGSSRGSLGLSHCQPQPELAYNKPRTPGSPSVATMLFDDGTGSAQWLSPGFGTPGFGTTPTFSRIRPDTDTDRESYTHTDSNSNWAGSRPASRASSPSGKSVFDKSVRGLTLDNFLSTWNGEDPQDDPLDDLLDVDDLLDMHEPASHRAPRSQSERHNQQQRGSDGVMLPPHVTVSRIEQQQSQGEESQGEESEGEHADQTSTTPRANLEHTRQNNSKQNSRKKFRSTRSLGAPWGADSVDDIDYDMNGEEAFGGPNVSPTRPKNGSKRATSAASPNNHPLGLGGVDIRPKTTGNARQQQNANNGVNDNDNPPSRPSPLIVQAFESNSLAYTSPVQQSAWPRQSSQQAQSKLALHPALRGVHDPDEAMFCYAAPVHHALQAGRWQKLTAMGYREGPYTDKSFAKSLKSANVRSEAAVGPPAMSAVNLHTDVNPSISSRVLKAGDHSQFDRTAQAPTITMGRGTTGSVSGTPELQRVTGSAIIKHGLPGSSALTHQEELGTVSQQLPGRLPKHFVHHQKHNHQKSPLTDDEQRKKANGTAFAKQAIEKHEGSSFVIHEPSDGGGGAPRIATEDDGARSKTFTKKKATLTAAAKASPPGDDIGSYASPNSLADGIYELKPSCSIQNVNGVRKAKLTVDIVPQLTGILKAVELPASLQKHLLLGLHTHRKPITKGELAPHKGLSQHARAVF